MNNHVVAFIMTVYSGDNCEDFSSAVKSIKEQDYPLENIRLYLFVDGIVSEDIYCFIKSESFFYKVIYSEKNVGLACGLNVLIKSIENEEFIFRMDSDDVCSPSRVKKQVAAFQNTNVDILGGAIQEFIGDKKIIFNRIYPTRHQDIRRVMCKASPFAHVTVAFRKSALEILDAYPTEFGKNEDIAMWVKSLDYSLNYGNLTDVLVLVRMDNAYARRDISKLKGEIKLYSQAMNKLNAPFSSRIHLIFRALLRLSPSWLTKLMYTSHLRSIFTK
ncbi:TPA: glycosyltransferase [Vibrio harveyi]